MTGSNGHRPEPHNYPSQYLAPYQPLPWQIPAWRDKSPIVLLSGSAGGGKSRLAAEKIHGFCKKYAGATALMLRKTRESMTNSTVLFMQRVVVGNDPTVRFLSSKFRFEYENGSMLMWGGMKDEQQREHVRSIGIQGGLDYVWMEEATHFLFQDFQEIITRLRGKAAPWTQIQLTTNPDAPLHWINQRMILGGKASVHYSGALDNPHNPPEYIAWLEMLEGVQYDRLVKGLWVMAEGVIYDNFTLQHNVSPDAAYHPDKGPVFWGMDDGYAEGQGIGHTSYHPRVVLLAQMTPVGGLDVFAEYYKTGVADYADTIEEVLGYGYPRPDLVYVDSSAAMLRGALGSKGLHNMGATHKVAEGIKNLRRLVCDGQGVRLLRIHPDCRNLVRELQSYRYNQRSTVATGGEPAPLKIDDHGPDSLRYLAQRLRTN